MWENVHSTMVYVGKFSFHHGGEVYVGKCSFHHGCQVNVGKCSFHHGGQVEPFINYCPRTVPQSGQSPTV